MEKYIKIEKLGEGASGVVYLCKKSNTISENKSITDYVAIKRFRFTNESDGLRQEAIRELKYMQDLNHDNILNIIDVFQAHLSLNIVLPYMESDLERLIDCKRIVFTPANIKTYMYMILSGLEYIHRYNIIHRDIKPGNCLISGNGNLKIGDFGLARIYTNLRPMSPDAFTIWYRPPELLFGAKKYDSSVDMWAVGCIFAELLLRKPIFNALSEIDQISKIFSILGTPKLSEINYFKTLPSYIEVKSPSSSQLPSIFSALQPNELSMLTSLLAYNPQNRPTSTQALSHPYFHSPPKMTEVKKLPRFIK